MGAMRLRLRMVLSQTVRVKATAYKHLQFPSIIGWHRVGSAGMSDAESATVTIMQWQPLKKGDR
jgi:hypothetical protein